jgi:hypothetical protein
LGGIISAQKYICTHYPSYENIWRESLRKSAAIDFSGEDSGPQDLSGDDPGMVKLLVKGKIKG